jgi:hypothetical protein
MSVQYKFLEYIPGLGIAASVANTLQAINNDRFKDVMIYGLNAIQGGIRDTLLLAGVEEVPGLLIVHAMLENTTDEIVSELVPENVNLSAEHKRRIQTLQQKDRHIIVFRDPSRNVNPAPNLGADILYRELQKTYANNVMSREGLTYTGTMNYGDYIKGRTLTLQFVRTKTSGHTLFISFIWDSKGGGGRGGPDRQRYRVRETSDNYIRIYNNGYYYYNGQFYNNGTGILYMKNPRDELCGDPIKLTQKKQ